MPQKPSHNHPSNLPFSLTPAFEAIFPCSDTLAAFEKLNIETDAQPATSGAYIFNTANGSSATNKRQLLNAINSVKGTFTTGFGDSEDTAEMDVLEKAEAALNGPAMPACPLGLDGDAVDSLGGFDASEFETP